MNTFVRTLRALLASAALAALASCGGSPAKDGEVKAQACSVNNPFRADAKAPISGGNLATEKTWLRDHVDRKYLWYDKVPAVDANLAVYSRDTPTGFYGSIDTYFLDLVQPLTNPPGKPVDQFSFTYPTKDWDALLNSGSAVGYGIEWHFDSTTPPRNIRVAYVHAGSTAAAEGLLRGDTLVTADNIPADDPVETNALNAALFPATGTTHAFRFTRTGTSTPIDVSMTAGPVTLTPVQSNILTLAGGQRVGYLLFNDHVLTAEQSLINAFTSLQNANPPINDLVLDLRYNGGGYLFIASEVGYMIAGAARTTGAVPPKPFESTVFSDKRSSENTTAFFENRACLPNPASFDCTSNAPLPTLNLPRVYVLVSGSTCSASEAIVNGLRGVDVAVHLIGSTTCGKPYGFFGQDNCGITYFPIEFQGVNAKNFGAYADGFKPANGSGAGFAVPGCSANDDLDHALGDPAEGQLSAALAYRHSNNATCPPPTAVGRQAAQAAGQAAVPSQGRVVKPAALTSRFGRMPAR
ncbi:MAG TPA: S41 family peptidase [Burkholderiaceae bacterium]